MSHIAFDKPGMINAHPGLEDGCDGMGKRGGKSKLVALNICIKMHNKIVLFFHILFTALLVIN